MNYLSNIFPSSTSYKNNTVVASSTVLSHEDEIQAFHRDFELHFQNLANAMAKSESVGSIASSIDSKGTLSMLWGTLNGNNDKEFAQMAGDLAASLTTTQVVLQIILQLNHRKNGVLKGFHQVLVDKISLLTKDSKMLDSNQRGATIVILEELRNHVSAQMEQQELVFQHEQRLYSLDQYVSTANRQANDFHHGLSTLGLAVTALSEKDQELRNLLDRQRTYIDEEKKGNDERQQRISRLEFQLATQKKDIETLEETIARSGSPRAILLRNALPFAALALAATALLKAVNLLDM